VAVVTPRGGRRSSAGAWAPLLRPQADLRLYETPDEEVSGADLVILDEECPDLDRWIADAAAEGRAPETILVFSSSGDSRRGAIPWGVEGEDVLATISDLLDRKQLLDESDEFLSDLRASNERLDRHRQRFSRLVLDQSEALRGANVSLSREVDRLERLQSLARFFAAPGPDGTFVDRLAEVFGRAIGAAGVAIVLGEGAAWTIAGRWKISNRNARGILPDEPATAPAGGGRPTTRKEHVGWWLPAVGMASAGAVATFRSGREPEGGVSGLEPFRELLGEGLAARAESQSAAWRGSQSERILETLKGGLLKLDDRGRVTVVNPAMAEILQAPVDEIEGAPLERIIPRDPHLHGLLRRVLDGGEPLDDHETYLTSSSGRRVSVSVRASTVGAPEAPEGVLVLVADLSRRKEVEAEFRKADRLVALGRLSAGVAHEIRNPLAGILTTAEVLRSRVEGSQDLERFVDVILEESARLDRIVNSMLQFARPPSPRRTGVELRPLLERATRLAAGRAADRGVTVRLEAADDLPVPLADRDQILQVLLNLLLNGIEATPAGGHVDVTARARPEREVHLIVEDGGEGIPPELRERIFDPFFTTKPGGTGLGLSISQNILRQHGGRLRMENDGPGRNRVVAVLPIAPPDDDAGMGGRGGAWRTS